MNSGLPLCIEQFLVDFLKKAPYLESGNFRIFLSLKKCLNWE